MSDPIERVIFHVDLDAFFVAVETVLNPDLKGKPVVVGGMGSRGVVSTASYEARCFGVHSGMAMYKARKLCPKAIFKSGTRGVYSKYSRRFKAILSDFTPTIETVSIDEAYLDMTGTSAAYGPPEATATNIRNRIREELCITGSIGIGPNKLVAKVATNHAKPDGQLQIRAHQVKAFFAPLSIRELPGIGSKIATDLEGLGISSLGDLAAFNTGWLRRRLGRRNAEWLQRRAKGEGGSVIEERHEPKSVSAEETFAYDVSKWQTLRQYMFKLCEETGRRLRRLDKNARTIYIKVRYENFETITRQITIEKPICSDLEIFRTAEKLMLEVKKQRTNKIRLLGVGVRGLQDKAEQLSFNHLNTTRRYALDKTVDKIRIRYGKGVIVRGL